MISGPSINKYVTYQIEGDDKNGPFEIRRRYSEFGDLYNLLLTNWPGCFIPPIPSKKNTGNLNPKFI